MNWRQDPADRAVQLLIGYSGWYIAGILLVTGLLVLPMLLMAPTEQASQDPGGPVFELQERINQEFPARIHGAGFIVEDRQGDILRQKPLWELYQNQERLRKSELGNYLYNGYDAEAQRQTFGLFTIADGVSLLLALDREGAASLATATDLEVKLAVHRLLSGPNGEQLRDSLSMDADSETRTFDGEEFQYWRAPALFFFVASDNALLGGGPPILSLSNDQVTLDKERFNRQIQETLRGSQVNYRLWGLAIDVNLESLEQGRTVLPYIGATILLVLVVVGVTLRSWSSAVLAFVGLLMVLIWLKGGSNLVGLNSSLTLDLIVPIAIISLGVDFFIHASAHYQKERRLGRAPSLALGTGLATVIGALTLAMLSDGIAFLANITSGIETIIGFAVAAGIATIASYLVMGIFLPLVRMRLDGSRLLGFRRPFPAGPVSPVTPATPSTRDARTANEASGGRLGFVGIVAALVQVRWIVLSSAAAVTVVSTYLAFQLEPQLDVKEFFASESDLIVGLEKLEQHVDLDLAGEPGVVYIRGDLTSRESLAAIEKLLTDLGQNLHLGSDDDGQVRLYRQTVLTLLYRLTGSDYAREQIEAEFGVRITDDDGDGQPDDPIQLRTAYEFMHRYGVPRSADSLYYDRQQVRETVSTYSESGGEMATILIFGVRGTREQATLAQVRQSLETDLEPVRQVSSISFAGITGSPFTRESTLHAATKALNVSLPVAVVACLILLAVWLRSLRLAVAAVIPMGLVVSWLYAFMYLAGFHLNFVTATIAAVSIGLGIDYSIHVTLRFRREMERNPDRTAALRATASGVGGPLIGSAASSAIGFGVLAFAPMPLFSAYGVITATMIAMAAGAALVVLPSLLTLAIGGSTLTGGQAEGRRDEPGARP